MNSLIGRYLYPARHRAASGRHHEASAGQATAAQPALTGGAPVTSPTTER